MLICSELVQIHSEGEADVAALRIATRRVDRVQRIVSCGCPLELLNVASLPSVVLP